jgi:hypothetical protein
MIAPFRHYVFFRHLPVFGLPFFLVLGLFLLAVHS